MSFAQPWWLVALPPVLGLVWLVARRGARAVPRRQHRWAVISRAATAGLLVVAAAQPVLARPVATRSVLFLVDRSDSIGPQERLAQEQYVAEALSHAFPDFRTGVAVFGAGTRVDAALAADRRPVEIGAEVDGSATDIASALRAAAALLPTEGSRRVVLITDLAETADCADPAGSPGCARLAAAEMAEQGIAVDVVAVPSRRGGDALVESVELPTVAREGEIVPVRAVIRSNAAGPALVLFRAADGQEQSIPVELEEGRNEVAWEVSAGRPGFLAVSVELDAAGDTRPENDRAEGLTRVLGPARVAVVEGRPGEGEELTRALEAGNLAVDRRPGIPSDSELLEYDALVLVNVPAPSSEDARHLAAFVEDLGRGLVVVGGDQAYGLGGYQDTALETLLPVSSDPDELVRRQPVAEVLVIDSSGSMGACHCRGGQFEEGGVVKTEIARAGAALAIEALSDSDRVGVLAFSSGTQWVLPLGTNPTDEDVEAALGAIIPEGDTEIARALEVALEELEEVPEGLRHIVLFTDGWDPNDANLLPIARRIADEGVTLSVLGTGEGPGVTLERMAAVGGGRYYPGTDLQAVPEVFVQETLAVARNLAVEGSFLPVLAAASQVTAELTESPPLLGYVLTEPKGTASVPLEIGQGDPLLATWQRGLGRATAWTSDATSRWSAGWVDWDGYAAFWGRVVGDVLPAGRDTPPEVRVEGGQVHVTYRAEEAGIDAAAVARVRGPEGRVTVLPLDRVDSATFAGTAPAGSPGAYWVAVTVDDPDGTVRTSSSGAVSSYEEEFTLREPHPGLAAELAAATGGREGPQPEDVFVPAPSMGRAQVSVWPWLAALALVLFLADVALRRLVLVAEDAAAWKEGFKPRRLRERRRLEERRRWAEETGRRTEQAPPPRSDSETLSRLLRRKRR